MLKKRLLIFLGLLAVSKSSPSGLQLLFPEVHRQYSYVVKTNVTSGTLTPSEAGSYWTLEAKLVVQVYDNFTKVRLKLDDLKTSVYSKNQGYSTYQSEEAAQYLKKPWELEYQDNGYITSFYVDKEPVWTTNIKRALSINFQLKKETETYTNDEPCLFTSCVVVYISKGNTIRKYNNLRLSSLSRKPSWSSVPEIWTPGYEGRDLSDSIATAERVYELDDNKGLVSLDLKGSFQYKTHNHILSVSSELSLNYDTDAPLEGMEKLNLTKTDLLYVAHDYNDPSNSIRSRTQNDLRNRTYEILMKIAKKGIDADNIVRNASLIHSMDFIDLLNTMSQLKYASLSKLFADMVLGTSYDIETSRNIFLEVLPHVRTNACARFVKYLVVEHKENIEDATLLSLLRKLPFNVANHSQSLLEELEAVTKLGLDFSQEIRHAGILSFATLVYKAREVWQVKQDYFDNIVVKYFRMYSDCPQYLDRMVWLQGLCNIGYSADSYTRTIYIDSTKNRHERLWAALGATDYRLYSVLENSLPILMDEKEPIQLRIAALHMFLKSDIRASDFIYVHNFIKNCNNMQLKRFWYTTVKNLENNKHFGGYRTASYFVPFVSSQVTNPDSTYWATNNYIISSQDDNGAAALQVVSVGNPLTALPAFVAIKLSTGGRRPHHAAVYLIAEGVTTNMFKKFHTINEGELNVDRLVEVLRKMKVQVVEPEKVHIDVVFKVHDKTVYATHINQTRFNSWNGEDLIKSIKDFLRFGSHINQQLVYYPYQMDLNIPTELGTPVRLQSTIMSFTSIRGNLTAPCSQDLVWRNDLHIRYQGTTVTSLSTDGPLLQSEHTTRIQQSIVAHLPMIFDVKVVPSTLSFEFTWPNPGAQNGGIAMHSRVQVAMESAKGKDSYTVTTGENKYGVDDTGIFFDCERPMTGTELVEKLLTSKTDSYDFLTSLQPSLIILNVVVLVTSPTSGSCGLILPPRRLIKPGNNVLDIKLRMEGLNLVLEDKVVFKLDHSITYRENKSQGEVYLNVTGYTKLESGGGNISVEMVVAGQHPYAVEPGRKMWTFCIHEQDISHATSDQDITTHPASYEGRLTVTFLPDSAVLTCPQNGSQLLVQYRGIPSDNSDPLERYFEVKMHGRELPNLAESGLSTQTPWGQLLMNVETQPLNITAVIKEKNGVASVSINRGPEMQFKSDNFAWLLDSWSNMQIMKKFGLYRECRLQESTVQTLSGLVDRLPPLKCSEGLALADCSDSPRFAVLRLKNGGVKIYTGGNYVAVVGDENGANVSVNGEQECHGDCVYPSDTPIYDFKISRIGDAVKFHSRISGVQVYYRRSETVILTPHSYVSSACGECVAQYYFNSC